MSQAEIKYSPAALSDLDEIWGYIAHALSNPQAAERTVGSIIDSVSRLSMFPDSGSPLTAIYPAGAPYRFVTAGNYLAFYRHVEETVFVDRILYSRSDYLRVLFGE